MRIRGFRREDEPEVIALWARCELTRPWNDPASDIARKLAVADDMFFVGVVDERVVATVMAGFDGHRGWINYLAVHPDHQGRGFGRDLMLESERVLHERGCPKINLQVRATNARAVAFYDRLGYATDDVVSLGKRLDVV